MHPVRGGVRISRMLHGKLRNPTHLLPEALMATPVYLGRPEPLPPFGAISEKTRRSSPPGFTPLHLVHISFVSTENQLAIRFLLRGGPTTGSKCCTRPMTLRYRSSKATTPSQHISPPAGTARRYGGFAKETIMAVRNRRCAHNYGLSMRTVRLPGLRRTKTGKLISLRFCRRNCTTVKHLTLVRCNTVGIPQTSPMHIGTRSCWSIPTNHASSRNTSNRSVPSV